MYTRKWHMHISQHAETHTLIFLRSMGFCLKLAYLYNKNALLARFQRVVRGFGFNLR